MVVLSDLHNSEFGAYNSELVDVAAALAFTCASPVGHVEALRIKKRSGPTGTQV